MTNSKGPRKGREPRALFPAKLFVFSSAERKKLKKCFGFFILLIVYTKTVVLSSKKGEVL